MNSDLKKRIAQLCADDPERAHAEADEILCEALERHGEYELVAAWRAVRKWYS